MLTLSSIVPYGFNSSKWVHQLNMSSSALDEFARSLIVYTLIIIPPLTISSLAQYEFICSKCFRLLIIGSAAQYEFACSLLLHQSNNVFTSSHWYQLRSLVSYELNSSQWVHQLNEFVCPRWIYSLIIISIFHHKFISPIWMSSLANY